MTSAHPLSTPPGDRPIGNDCRRFPHGVSLLEQFMPRFDTRSQHAIEVHAPAQAVFTAVETVTLKEVRFLRELEFLRALPGLAATGRLDVPTADAPLILSFTPGAVLLGARPPEEVL